MRTRCRIVVAAVATVANFCFAVMYAISCNSVSPASIVELLNTSSVISLSSSAHFNKFQQALTVRADADRFIILAMTDEAFVDMAINFYEVSLQAHQINNFLFVGLGPNACTILQNMSIPCFYYADDPNAGRASDYGGGEFNRKVRNSMMMEALAANFTVIHSDIDIVFIGNPLQQLKVNRIIFRNCILCS